MERFTCICVYIISYISHPIVSTVFLCRFQTTYGYLSHNTHDYFIIPTLSPYTGKGVPSIIILHTSHIRSGNIFYNTYKAYRNYLPSTSPSTVRQYIQCGGHVSISYSSSYLYITHLTIGIAVSVSILNILKSESVFTGITCY